MDPLGVAFNLAAMAIVVDVSLMSGQRVPLEADLTASVHSVAEHARKALGVGRGRLFSSFGSLLDGDTELGAAKLQTGDCLTLQVSTVLHMAAAIVSQPSWEMGLWSHGAVQGVVVTAVPCQIS